MSEAQSQVAHQPLHPSIRDKLDPEYVSLHDQVLQYVKPNESEGWSPASRKFVSPLGAGAQKDVEVGKITNHEIADGIQARIFTPEGQPASSEGWPCLVWLHGGGWVNGGLNSENGFLRHFCKCKRADFHALSCDKHGSWAPSMGEQSTYTCAT